MHTHAMLFCSNDSKNFGLHHLAKRLLTPALVSILRRMLRRPLHNAAASVRTKI
jgi:hypothetical protein